MGEPGHLRRPSAVDCAHRSQSRRDLIAPGSPLIAVLDLGIVDIYERSLFLFVEAARRDSRGVTGRLTRGDPKFAAVQRSYQKALLELKPRGDPSDAITDAARAPQERPRPAPR